MTSTSIIDMVLGGQADAELDGLIEAVKERRKTLARRSASSIKPGDTVTFNSTIRPTYLAGLEATVEKVNRESVSVRIKDAEQARRFGRGPVRCPLSFIEVAS